MASIRQTKKYNKRIGNDDSFLGIGKKAKEKKAAKQAAKANGIKQPTAAGKLLGSLGIGRNAKKNQSSGGGIAAFGTSLAKNSLTNSVQSVSENQGEKKSFGETMQNVLEGVGGIARAGAGLVGAVRGATGSGGGGEYQEEGGIPAGEYDDDGGGGAMNWLKKNWFIPVGVLVVGIGIYLFTRRNK